MAQFALVGDQNLHLALATLSSLPPPSHSLFLSLNILDPFRFLSISLSVKWINFLELIRNSPLVEGVN
jgi:hypothetical protein